MMSQENQRSQTSDNEDVPIVPSAWIHQSKIDSAVKRAERVLKPDVVRIRYSFAPDWIGEQSIFFRIVLSDEASRQDRLSDTAQRVSLALVREVHTEEMGLHAYFNFRSQSEQAQLREPAWS